jgi:phage-related protein
LFYGAEFVYGGVSSVNYDLRIMNFGSSEGDSNAGGDVSIISDWIVRRPKAFYFGRSQNTPLEFDFTVGSFNPVPGWMRSKIENWLIGSMNYMPLQIIQDDIQIVTYNVIITKATNKYIGNLNYAINLHAYCDAPWGFESLKTFTKSYVLVGVKNETFNFYNGSDNPDYLYPSISFTLDFLGTDFTLTNNSEVRSSIFTGLSTGETITIDDKFQITSSTGLHRMSNFNKKFFRLLPGMNSITILGSIYNFSMAYQFARKIGG